MVIHDRARAFACNGEAMASNGDPAQVFVFLSEIGKRPAQSVTKAAKIPFCPETFHLMTVIRNTLFSVDLSYELPNKENKKTPQHVCARHTVFV